jgi:EAL domain-containing protein (putative c-di-GMP-specific phosphodiesterase class I)
LLSDLGCDLGQGNFISKPRPANRLTFGPRLAGSQPATSRGTAWVRRTA